MDLVSRVKNILLDPQGTGVNSFEVNTTDTLNLTGNISGPGALIKGNVAGTTGILAISGNRWLFIRSSHQAPLSLFGSMAAGGQRVTWSLCMRTSAVVRLRVLRMISSYSLLLP